MKMGLVDVDWSYVGARLAQSDSNEQVAFLKAFVKECKTWGTEYQVQVQFAHVNGELTDNEIETLSMLTYKESK